VLFMNRIAKEGAFEYRDGWLFGVTSMNWLVWQGGAVVGIGGGAFIPTNWGLQFAGTWRCAPLVMPSCRLAGRHWRLTASCVALLGNGWPHKAGLLAGVGEERRR
jgi:predicted branched-subunit amino acid permease